MQRRSPLGAALHWFQSRVVAPHERRRPARLAPAASVILPSKTLLAEERMAIYSEAYLARLMECLAQEYPALKRLIGPRTFHEICRAYLERFPSRSPSLNPLGRGLPEFLSGRVKMARRKAAKDLASLEAAMSEVFDGEAALELTPSDLRKIPPQTLAGSRLEFVPPFRLLVLDHPVNDYVDAVRQGRKRLPPLRRRRSWVAVYRKGFQVRRLDLQKAAFAALSALRSGRTVAEAVAAAARVWRGSPVAFEAQIRRWFGGWASEGFFSSCRPVR